MEDFHDLLVPDALEYYLGLNEDFDMLGMDGEGDESEGDGSGSEEDEKPAPKKGGKKGGKGGDAPQVGPDGQECKQQ